MSHVSLITLAVDDLERSTAFYEALGWRRSTASVAGTVAFLRGGASVLSLFGRADLAAESGIDARTLRGPGGVVLATNLGSVAAVDELFARVEDAGGRITARPQATEWGGYSGYLADPDGHPWEVAHNPHFPLDDDGRIALPDET